MYNVVIRKHIKNKTISHETKKLAKMQLLTTCAFFLLGSLGLSEKIQNDGMCQTIGELDLYLLLPTSAHRKINKNLKNTLDFSEN